MKLGTGGRLDIAERNSIFVATSLVPSPVPGVRRRKAFRCARRLKRWLRFWNYKRRSSARTVTKRRRRGLPTMLKLSAPALHLPMPRATG
jgi:hypothetical protein